MDGTWQQQETSSEWLQWPIQLPPNNIAAKEIYKICFFLDKANL
jgi:hypothetical protein